jgi:hypothetical protein
MVVKGAGTAVEGGLQQVPCNYILGAIIEPMPFGVFMVLQVPLATYFHEFGW